jgi:hypothetical protein
MWKLAREFVLFLAAFVLTTAYRSDLGTFGG